MKKLVQILIILAVLSAMVWGLCGCATMKGSAGKITIDVKVDPNDMTCYIVKVDANDVDVDFFTVGKDVNIGNKFMSTVSPENTGIIEALLGGVAGFFIAGM